MEVVEDQPEDEDYYDESMDEVWFFFGVHC